MIKWITIIITVISLNLSMCRAGSSVEIKTTLNSFEKLEEVDNFASKVSFTLVSQSEEYKTDGKYSSKVVFLTDGDVKRIPKVRAIYDEGAYPYKNWSGWEKFVMDIYNPQIYVVTIYLSLVSLGKLEKVIKLEPNRWTKIEVPIVELNEKLITEIAIFQKTQEMKEKTNVLYIDNLRLEGGDLAKIAVNKKEEDATALQRKPPGIFRTDASKILPEFIPNPGKISLKTDVPIVVKTQVLVVGGGSAGCAAAICAARQGAEVLLIERAGWLGGMYTSALVPIAFNVPLNEGIIREWVDLLQKLGGEGWKNPEILKYVLFKEVQNAGVKLLLYTLAVDAIVENNVIKGVIVESKSGRHAILADIVIDATGDGDVAAKSCAPFEIGRGRDEGTQTMTLVFVLGNVDTTRVWTWKDLDKWIKLFSEIKKTKEFHIPFLGPPAVEIIVPGEHGMVNFNSVNIPQVQGLDVKDLTYAHVESAREIIEAAKLFKKYVPGCEESYLVNMASYIGVRETRRIIGEYVLTGGDVLKGARFEDAITRGFYTMDVHNWDGSGDVGGLSVNAPYDIPYRCLVPLKIENLLVAGRCISTDHAALGSVREGIAMSIGQAAGTAAGLCIKGKTSPRKLSSTLLIETLVKQGVNLEREKVDTKNIALSQKGTKASADSIFQNNYSPECAIDGTIKGGTASRWLSDKTDPPHWLILDFGAPKTFEKIRLHFWSPPENPGTTVFIVSNYSLQYEEGGEWKEIISVENNKEQDPEYSFKPVTAQKIRFYVTRSCETDNIVRLYEIEVLEQ